MKLDPGFPNHWKKPRPAYPNGWRASKWISHDPICEVCYPGRAGCYVIYGDGRLLYVGQSSNVRSRLAIHRKRWQWRHGPIVTNWGTFSSMLVKVRYSEKSGDWLMREYRLINRLKPPMNSAGTGKKRIKRTSPKTTK